MKMSLRSCLLVPALLLRGCGTTDPQCPPTARRRRGSSLFLTLLVLSAGACGDSVTGVDTEPEDLFGTWSITSLLFAPDGGGSSVQGLEGTASISFRADFTYTVTFVDTQGTDVEEGTFLVSGSTLELFPTIDPTDSSTFTVTSISSTSATLVSEDDSFDFNDDGEETEATLTVSLTKQP